MGIYDGFTTEDLKLRLTELQTTYSAASTGQQLTGLAKGDKRLTFAPVDLKTLERQILELQALITARENPNATRTRGYAVAKFIQP